MQKNDIRQLEEIIAETYILNDIMLKTLKYYEYEEVMLTELVFIGEIINDRFKKINALF